MTNQVNGSSIMNQVICGDAAIVLKTLSSESIDLTVTSPPYDDLREYKGFIFDLDEIIKELYRITKTGGVVVWIVGDATKDSNESGTSFKQALRFKELGFKLHDTMIYQKNQYPPNCLSQNRYAQVFEYMFVFSKGNVKTFNRIMRKCKLAGKPKGPPSFVVQRNGERKQYGRNRSDVYHDETVERNIWIYDTGSANNDERIDHPAVFPEKLARDHIISWSNPKDIVLDPFAGSGTTLKMAKLERRNYIGIDISQEYCNLINKRLEKYNNQSLEIFQ